jgi:hypothetical protein
MLEAVLRGRTLGCLVGLATLAASVLPTPGALATVLAQARPRFEVGMHDRPCAGVATARRRPSL